MAKIRSLVKVKPKKYNDGDVVQMSLMVMHPMETGLRKDKKTGEIVPAHYIDSVKFEYNGKVVTSMKVWESVSTNPVFSTYLKIDGLGELKVTFTENTGAVHENSKKISPKG